MGVCTRSHPYLRHGGREYAELLYGRNLNLTFLLAFERAICKEYEDTATLQKKGALVLTLNSEPWAHIF